MKKLSTTFKLFFGASLLSVSLFSCQEQDLNDNQPNLTSCVKSAQTSLVIYSFLQETQSLIDALPSHFDLHPFSYVVMRKSSKKSITEYGYVRYKSVLGIILEKDFEDYSDDGNGQGNGETQFLKHFSSSDWDKVAAWMKKEMEEGNVVVVSLDKKTGKYDATSYTKWEYAFLLL